MKRFLTAIVLMLFCTSISIAIDNNLKKIDNNNDGKISKKEYINAVTNTFHKLDKNTDGFLDKEELKTIDKIDAGKILNEGDLNKDGKVSKDEFMKAAEKRFKVLDKNNDSYIDQKEWKETKESVNQNNPKISPIAPFIILSF